MNLSCERDAEQVVRMAETLLELPEVAWLDPARAMELLDPSAAMESVFRRLLGGGLEPSSDAGPEPDALFNSGFEPEPHLDPHEATASLSPRPARGRRPASPSPTVPEPHAPSDVPVRALKPVASDARADRLNDSGVRGRDSWLPHYERSPMADRRDAQAEPAAPHEARSESRRQPRVAAGSWIRSVERRASGRELVGSSPVIQVPTERDGIRDAGEDMVPGGSRGSTKGTPSRAAPFPDAAASRSTRLVTELSDLQSLFRSVVANSQSTHNRLPSDSPRPIERARPDDHSTPARATRQASHRDQVVHLEPVPVWPGPSRDDAPVGSLADTPVPSLSGAEPAMPDPAREEILLDRLLDRLEERLRDEAIRHLGFTGGLT